MTSYKVPVMFKLMVYWNLSSGPQYFYLEIREKLTEKQLYLLSNLSVICQTDTT